jgi:hypothetical protein
LALLIVAALVDEVHLGEHGVAEAGDDALVLGEQIVHHELEAGHLAAHHRVGPRGPDHRVAPGDLGHLQGRRRGAPDQGHAAEEDRCGAVGLVVHGAADGGGDALEQEVALIEQLVGVRARPPGPT